MENPKAVTLTIETPIWPHANLEKIHRTGPRSAHITSVGAPIIPDDVLLFPSFKHPPAEDVRFTWHNERAFRVTEARSAKGVTKAWIEDAATYPLFTRFLHLLVGQPKVGLPDEGQTAIVIFNDRVEDRGVEVVVHD